MVSDSRRDGAVAGPKFLRQHLQIDGLVALLPIDTEPSLLSKRGMNGHDGPTIAVEKGMCQCEGPHDLAWFLAHHSWIVAEPQRILGGKANIDGMGKADKASPGDKLARSGDLAVLAGPWIDVGEKAAVRVEHIL